MLNPAAYVFDWGNVDPGLRELLDEGTAAPGEAVAAGVLREVVPGSFGLNGAYRLQLFTEQFCKVLMEEVDHINRSGLPMRRPNGMNRHQITK